MPANPLTPDQEADAARLKAIYTQWKADEKKAGRPANQEIAAEALGFGQSALSQYANGKIPLNVPAIVAMARFFGCAIEAISPALASQVDELAQSGSVKASPVAAKPARLVLDATTLTQALKVVSQSIASSDGLGRATLKPLFDALLSEPEKADEIIHRIEIVISASSGGKPTSGPVGNQDKPDYL